jgi:endonuclease/exonuclease/phosphatase family metal-dependent hydrolase
VATLNAWGLPWDLARHTLRRMRAIREGLAGLGADLVALQEVWSAEARQVLLEGALRAGWGWRWHNRAELGGSGLLVLSRLPIAEARFDPFRLRGRPERLRHGDYWGGKGFALLGIETPGGPVALVDTHLHAQYDADAADEYLGERAGQVVELVAGLSGVAAPLVAAGDFNLREDQPLYRVLTGLGGLRDTAAEIDAREPTVLASNPYRSQRPQASARIDYLFVRDGIERGIRVRSVERIFDEALRLGGEPAAASDHAGLLAELEIGAPAAARPALDPEAGRLARRLLEDGREAARARRDGRRGAGAAALAGGAAALATRRSRLGRRAFLRSLAAGTALLAVPAGLGVGAFGELRGRDEIAAFDAALRSLEAMLSRGGIA